PRWAHGRCFRSELAVFVLRVFVRLVQPGQGALTLLQAFAMPFGGGLDHLGLLRLDLRTLLINALLGRLQRVVELLTYALLMPIRADNLFATIVGIEGAMVNHALKAVFLSLAALSVYLGPRGRRHGRLDSGRAPVHQGLTLNRLNKHKMPGIIGPGYLPWPTRDLCAILARLL